MIVATKTSVAHLAIGFRSNLLTNRALEFSGMFAVVTLITEPLDTNHFEVFWCSVDLVIVVVWNFSRISTVEASGVFNDTFCFCLLPFR